MLDPLRRGAVLRRAGHHLITWTHPWGFVLRVQTRPLHRAHVALRGADATALGLAPGAWIIDTQAPCEIVPTDTILAMSSPALLTRIEAAILRHHAACRREAAT